MKQVTLYTLFLAFICCMTSIPLLSQGENDNYHFFTSSNTQNVIGVFTVDSDGQVNMNSIRSIADDADGIFYDQPFDLLFQLNRSANKINGYTDVLQSVSMEENPPLSIFSTANTMNGREIAVDNGKLVIAQDANDANDNVNKFAIYSAGPGSVTFDKSYETSINLWGIHIDGSTLIAIEDNSNRVAMYEDFFTRTSSSIEPSSLISVDGIVRTHGLTYDADADLMILTDVGEASSATDGAIVVIANWTDASADGTVSSDEQFRIAGEMSLLGNPVDVDVSPELDVIYVAERANGGGRILGFDMPSADGDMTPSYNSPFAGASAIHLYGAAATDCDFVRGGCITFDDGSYEKTITVDGQPDMLSFTTNIDAESSEHSFTFVVTDSDGMILGIPMGNTVDFDPAGTGTCLLYGLSYTGNLNIEMGDQLDVEGLEISDGCFQLSSNSISVNRFMADNAAAQFFASSNNSGQIGVFNIFENNEVTMTMFPSVADDADGIFYDQATDVLYQLNRTANKINGYINVNENLSMGENPQLDLFSSANSSNGREMAAGNGKLIVAQDANDANGGQNKLVLYNYTASSIDFDKSYDVDINLWGIHLDGTTLIAIEDNSNRVAIYEDFFNNSAGPISSTNSIEIENLVRTHGLTYDANTDLMLLTDVGEASSPTDGAIIVIENWTTAIADGTVSMDEQVRVEGAMSLLGNPVDIGVTPDLTMVFVAERANGGGRILGYEMPVTSGDQSPIYNKLFMGASAIHLTSSETGPCDFVQGGSVALIDGTTETTIIVDGNADMLSFMSNVDAEAGGFSFTYVVTDADGMILGIPGGNTVDFDPAGLGVCRVYGVSYTGNLNIEMGDDFLVEGLVISDDCFEVSNNFISVNRVSPPEITAQFFASSNTQKTIGVFDIDANNDISMSSFRSIAKDADGIYYDPDSDVLFQLNRTANKVNAYGEVNASLENNSIPPLTLISQANSSNGREIAVSEGKLVVAQDANDANGNQNRFVLYDVTSSSIAFDKIYDVSINLWGINADGNTMFAIIDNSSDVAIFSDFFDNDAGDITPTSTVTIADLVRTHGITYDPVSDLMILTDVGEATSPTDGGLVIIPNWETASADGEVSADEQIRIAGPMSLLGNPVDVAFDTNSDMIFVAERANGGGRILGFMMPSMDGDVAPIYNKTFAGASAVFMSGSAAGLDNVGTIARNAHINEELIEVEAVVNRLYPVPATNNIFINIESSESVNTSLQIFDGSGKQVHLQNIGLSSGNNQISVNVERYDNGIYYMRIPALQISKKFIKVN